MEATSKVLTAEPVDHAPQSRCYQCGSAEITHTCHHCGRLGCARHVTATPTVAGHPLSPEFRRLGMRRKAGYHCADCAHAPSVAALAYGASGGALLLIGIAVLSLNPVAGVVLVILGAVASAGSLASWHRQRRHGPTLPLPVSPKITEVRLREEITGRVTLGPDLTYRGHIEKAAGKVTAALLLGRPERAVLDRYRRTRRLAPGSDVPFTAGSLVLRGQAGIDLSGEIPGLVIPLQGTTADYPVFTSDDPVPSPFRVEYTYDLAPDRRLRDAPVWITPAIASRSDRRALEIHIQWVDTGRPGPSLELETVESLELRVPVHWGNAESASRPGSMSTRGWEEGDQVLRTLEWVQLRPDAQERGRHRLELVVRFEEQVIPEDPAGQEQPTISGRLDAVFTGTLSGLSSVRLYGPLGAYRPSFSAEKARTRIVLDFELSLTGIRYQEVQLVPDRKSAEALVTAQSCKFPGVIPDDETVISLTNAISAANYYVKRVIENPPRSGARANRVQRYWDIAGRLYEGVYPIDFHVVLTGEEIHRGGIRAYSGTTETRLTVWGAYANPEMRDSVKQVWEALHDLVQVTLHERARAARLIGDRRAAAPDWTAFTTVPGSTGNGSGSGHEGPRKAVSLPKLLELLGLLDEALLHGRISEEHYWQMRTKAEQDLRGPEPSGER